MIFMQTLKIRPETIQKKQTLTGDWPLSKLFKEKVGDLLSGKELPLGPDYSAKFDKLHGALRISDKRDPYFVMNLWIRNRRVRTIEAYEKKKAHLQKPSFGRRIAVKGPLVEMGMSLKRAKDSLRELSGQGLLKKDALKLLNTSPAKEPKKVALH
jgi:hypothetical protein